MTDDMTAEETRRAQEHEEQRDRIRTQHLKPAGERPASSARGLHHTALVSSDVEATVRFYQDLLEFPLTELIEKERSTLCLFKFSDALLDCRCKRSFFVAE